MAKGPQTDGDAERAINELVKNPNDPENVKLQMGRIKASLDRTARNESLAIDTMRENYGKGPMDKSAYENQESTTEIPNNTGISDADLQYTAQKHGISVERVKQLMVAQ